MQNAIYLSTNFNLLFEFTIGGFSYSAHSRKHFLFHLIFFKTLKNFECYVIPFRFLSPLKIAHRSISGYGGFPHPLDDTKRVCIVIKNQKNFDEKTFHRNF